MQRLALRAAERYLDSIEAATAELALVEALDGLDDWAEERGLDLEEILIEKGYVASLSEDEIDGLLRLVRTSISRQERDRKRPQDIAKRKKALAKGGRDVSLWKLNQAKDLEDALLDLRRSD